MTKYDKGRRFEWKTRDDMTANGYDVLRAAGSKGGTKIDLVGFKPGQLLIVQCKEDGKLGPAEWNRVVEVAGWVGAIPLLAANGPNGRGVTYTRLLGPKIPRARTQPCEPFHLDEIADQPEPEILWQYGKPDLDEPDGLMTYDGTPSVISPRMVRRPLAPAGPWEPALRIAPECSTRQMQVHATCDGCDCRCHTDLARPVVAPHDNTHRGDIDNIALPGLETVA